MDMFSIAASFIRKFNIAAAHNSEKNEKFIFFQILWEENKVKTTLLNLISFCTIFSYKVKIKLLWSTVLFSCTFYCDWCFHNLMCFNCGGVLNNCFRLQRFDITARKQVNNPRFFRKFQSTSFLYCFPEINTQYFWLKSFFMEKA